MPTIRYRNRDELIAHVGVMLERFCVREGKIIEGPDDIEPILRLKLAKRDREVFAVVFLDQRHRMLGYEELFKGTVNGAAVYPREIARSALRCNAVALILAHNHPSGNPEPSNADIDLTKRIVSVLGPLDMRVLDHIIVGGSSCLSFESRGLMSRPFMQAMETRTVTPYYGATKPRKRRGRMKKERMGV